MIIETLMIVMTTVAGAGITGFFSYYFNRPGNREMRIAGKARPAPAIEASPAPISQEMRDEIEQNERWWLRSFHTLMLSSGAGVTIRIIGEEYTSYWKGNAHVHKNPDRVALEGCICDACAKVLRDAEKMANEVVTLDDPWDISFDNRQLVAEIQRAYGLVPDGIAGPATIRAMLDRNPIHNMSIGAWKLVRAFKEFSAEQTRVTRHTAPGRGVDWEAEVAYWTALDRKSSRKRYA